MRLLRFIAAMLFVLSMSSVGSAGSTAGSFIRELETEVRGMLGVKDIMRANSLFAEHLDMPLFSQRCLSDHWGEFSPAERLRYQDLLERNIRKRMNEKTLLVPDDMSFRLIPQKAYPEEDGFVRIDNILRVKSNDIKLGVVLVKRGSGWRVVDYDFDGALLSRNYRGQFNYLIRKHGKDGFFSRLEEKLSTGKR